MSNNVFPARRTAGIAGLTAALGVSAFLGGAVANAGSGHGSTPNVKVGVQSAPAMKLVGSPDEKINTTGVQGDMRTTAMQGTVEKALQCDSTSKIARVSCDVQSPEATPQIKK
ncbi:MAG: hypothetical protein U0R66_01255 [Mycobacterium sp.]